MYPQRKFDSLNRECRTEFSSTETVIRSFWGKTKNIKVRYHIFGDDVKFDVYDINGKTIITNEFGKLKISLSGFYLKNKDINFRVLPNIISQWSKILKQKQ